MKLESDGSKGSVLIHTSLYSHGQNREHCLETFSIVITWGVGWSFWGDNAGIYWAEARDTNPYNTQDGLHTPASQELSSIHNVGGAELEKLWPRLLKPCAVHGVSRSRTRLSDVTFTFHFPALEKEMATHSSVLVWRIPGTAEPGGLPSMGLHRVGHG